MSVKIPAAVLIVAFFSPLIAYSQNTAANTEKKPNTDENSIASSPMTPPKSEPVGGGLPKAVISEEIGKHNHEIKACYEQELQDHYNKGLQIDGDLEGKVSVLFEINASGDVQKAIVKEATLKNAKVQSCMLENIRRWKFPQPAQGVLVTVTFPWVFKAAK